MQNLHYAFHRDYYDLLAEAEVSSSGELQKMRKTDFDKKNEDLCKAVSNNIYQSIEQLEGIQVFILETCYPGLLIGTGYPHNSGVGEAEIMLGFSFDYVSGMPYIPGSTVKGCLRAPFRSCPGYIAELLKTEWNEEDVLLMEKAIFENELSDNILEKQQMKGVEQRDIFFDAVLSSKGAGSSTVMAMDTIAPHIDKVNPKLTGLSEPIPINFLRVKPKVPFIFQFLLKDTRLANGKVVTAKQKLELFRSILLDTGIGAKTNVGYGKMVVQHI